MDPMKQKKINRYKGGISTIIVFVLFSFVNVFLIAFMDKYYLFSSYLSALIILILTELSQSYVWIAMVITLILLVPYIICAVFAKKHYGFMIAAAVFLSLDTLLLGGDMILSLDYGVDGGLIINLLFHIAAVVELIMAIVSKDAVKFMKEAKISAINAPDSVKTEVLPDGETVSVLQDTVTDDGDTDDSIQTRRLTITRKKTFYASMVKFDVIIDGVLVGTLKNGQSLTVMASSRAHALYVQLQNGNSDVLQIPAQAMDKTYELKPIAKPNEAYIQITELS